jgi:hypothetical protein
MIKDSIDINLQIDSGKGDDSNKQGGSQTEARALGLKKACSKCQFFATVRNRSKKFFDLHACLLEIPNNFDNKTSNFDQS